MNNKIYIVQNYFTDIFDINSLQHSNKNWIFVHDLEKQNETDNMNFSVLVFHHTLKNSYHLSESRNHFDLEKYFSTTFCHYLLSSTVFASESVPYYCEKVYFC